MARAKESEGQFLITRGTKIFPLGTKELIDFETRAGVD